MKGILGTLFLCAACSIVGHAQQTVLSSDTTKVVAVPVVHLIKPKPPKAIRNEMSVGVRLNTDGWSVFTDYGRVKTNDLRKADMFHNLIFLQLELSEKKDPREIKTASVTANSLGGSSNYIYGKINNLYVVKLGVGYDKLIAGKPDPGCVSIHWANTIGGDIGLLKPYYIDVSTQSDAIKYSTSNEQYFLDQNSIEGSAGFSKGLSEMKIIPGGYLRSALHFDFSTNHRNVLGVEVGGNIDYFFQKVQLMTFQDPRSMFADLFVSFQYGRRW